MENNIAHADTTTGGGGIIGTLGDLVGIKGNEKTTRTGLEEYHREEINNLKKFIEEHNRQHDRETQQEKEQQRERDARQDKVLTEIKQYLSQQEQRQIQQERTKQEQVISELKNRLDWQAEKDRDVNEKKQNERITALETICKKHEKEYEQLQKERLEKQLDEHTNKKNQEERLKILEGCLKNRTQLSCQPQSCMQKEGYLAIKKHHSCCQPQDCQPCD